MASTKFSQHRDDKPSLSELTFLQIQNPHTLPETHDPLPSKLVSLVFPHGLDAHLEEVEVRVAGEVPRLDHVTVEGPVLLAGPKPAYQFEVLVKVVILLPRPPPAVPETILGLEFVFPLGNGEGGECSWLNLGGIQLILKLGGIQITTSKG